MLLHQIDTRTDEARDTMPVRDPLPNGEKLSGRLYLCVVALPCQSGP